MLFNVLIHFIECGLSCLSEIDQLYKICCILGAPDWTAFPDCRNTVGLVNVCYSEVRF